MALSIPSEIIIEKNKLFATTETTTFGFELPGTLPAEFVLSVADDGAESFFVELLSIENSNGAKIRIANNSTSVRWNNQLWQRFRFEAGDIKEDGDNNEFSIKVSAIDGTIAANILTLENMMIGDEVNYYYVNTGYPELDAAITGTFNINEIVIDDEWVEIILGVESFYNNAFPAHVYRCNTCRYSPEMTDACGLANSDACDRKFSTCISLGMAHYFGGQPGIPGGVFSAT